MTQNIESQLQFLQEDPTNLEALVALERLVQGEPLQGQTFNTEALSLSKKSYRERNEPETVARVLGVELALVGDRVELWQELAKVYQEELGDENEAARCYEKILALSPNHEEAFEFLEDREMKRENWERLAQKFSEEAVNSQSKDLAVNLYLRAAQLCSSYSPTPEDAEPYLTKVLELEPKSRRAALLLGRLYLKTGKHRERLALAQKQAEVTGTREQKVRALLNATYIAKDDVQDLEAANNLLLQTIKLEPANLEALTMLRQIAEKTEEYTPLLESYEAALKARPRGEVERKILSEMGNVKWRVFGDMVGAEDAFKRVRKGDPAHPDMLQFYEAYYEARGEWKELINMLSTAQKVARDEQARLQIAEHTARLAEEKANQIDKAIEVWKWVQRQSPGHVEANRSLRRLYRVTGKWNALLELIKEELDGYHEEEKEKKVARYLEMVEIYRSELRLENMVISTYNSILALDPQNTHALDSLMQTYENMGRWTELLNILERRAESEQNPEQAAGFWRKSSKLWIERLKNYNQAVRPLERLLEVAPRDAEAIALLKDIYQKRRNFRALVQLGKKEVDLFDDPAQKRSLLIELADLAAQRLDRPKQAISFWNRILELDLADSKALDALEVLYEKERRYPALIEIYRRKLELAEGADARIGFLQKMANVWADKLERVERAVDVWRSILDIDPSHTRAHRALRETFIKRGDYDALEELFARTQSWDEYLQVLQSAADRTENTEEKISLYLRIAALSEQRLHKNEQAARAYERILSLEPRHKGAATSLRPFYRAEARWPKLVGVLEILLSYEPEPSGALPLLEELRQVTEDRLEDKAAAFEYQRRAFVLSPYEPNLRSDLERLAVAAKAQPSLFSTYTAVLPKLQDPTLAAVVTRRLAQLSEELGDHDTSQLYWEEIRKQSSTDPEALEALERLYGRAGLSEPLLEVLKLRADAATPEVRRELLSRSAAILEDVVEDPVRAINVHRTSLAEFPEHLSTLRSLERLLRRQEQHADLAEILQKQLPVLRKQGDKEGLVSALCSLGELYNKPLQNRDDAILYYQEALQEDPACAKAALSLEAFIPDEGRRLTVAEILEPYYRSQAQGEKLAGVLEIKIEAAEGSAKVPLLLELAQLYEENLSDEAKAFDSYRRALSLSPEEEPISEQLGRLAAGQNRFAEYAEALNEAAANSSPAAAARHYTTLGPIYEEGLEKPEEARRVWAKVLEIEPEREDAFSALSRLLESAGSHGQRLALLDERISRTMEADSRRSLLFERAELEEKSLSDVERAIATYNEIISLSPHDAEAVRSLERLYQSTNRWREFSVLLEDELSGATTPETRAALMCRLGEISEKHLQEPASAVDRFSSALEESPNYAAAVSALERLVEVPDERLRVARILEDCYVAAERHADVVRVLEIQYALQSDTPEAQEQLTRIAELQEQKLGNQSASYAAWRRLLLSNAEEERAREELERLGAVLNQQPDLAEVYATLLQSTNLDDTRRALFLQREAEIAEGALSDNQRAINSWRLLADLDPTHKASLDALERLYLSRDDWKNLDEILVRKGKIAASTAEEADLWLQIGEIRRDYSNDPDGAVQAYREALAINGSDRRAISALKSLYQKTTRPRDLVDLLNQELDLGPQDGADATAYRVALLYNIAEVQEKSLEEREQAISTYNNLLAEAPQEQKALLSLDRLYESSEQYPELLDVLDRRWEISTDASEKTLLRFRQGKLYEEKMADSERAIDKYEEVLSTNATHPGARASLEAMLQDDLIALRAARVLEPSYRSARETQRLAETLELIAERTDEIEEKVRRNREVATLCEQELNDPKRAFDATAKAFRADPSDDSLLSHLEALSPKAGGPKVVSSFLRTLVDDLHDVDLRIKLFLRIAELHKTELRDLEGAESYYQKAIDEDPQNNAALDALEALYENAGRWRDLVQVLRRRVDAALEPSAQVPLLHRIAKLWERRLNVPAEAISAYEQILEITPEDRAALDSLDALYGSQSRWPELLSLLERRLELVHTTSERVAIRTRMAELHLSKLEDGNRSLEEARQILAISPKNEATISLLERLVERPEYRSEAADLLEPIYGNRLDWPRLAALIDKRITDDLSPDEKKTLLTRLWRVKEEQLEDLEGAFATLARLFKEDPTDAKVRERMGRFAELLNKWEDLANALAVVVDDPMVSGDSTPSLSWDLARIYEERLSQPEKAVPYLQKIVQDPQLGEEASRSLEVLYRRLERWEDLLKLYQERAENGWDTQIQKELYRKASRLLETTLADNQRAISSYRRLLEIDEQDAQANDALERLLTAESQWRDLVEYYLRRQDSLGDDPRVTDVKFRLGQVYQFKLNEPENALDCYQEILTRVGSHDPSITALELLAKDATLRRRAAELLEPHLDARGEWQKRINLLESLLEIEDSTPEKVELLTKIARLWEINGREPRRAFDAYLRAYSLELGAPPIKAELERLAPMLRTWGELNQVLEKGVDEVSDDMTRGEILLEIGRIHDKELNDPARAIASFEKALAHDGSSEPALNALDRLYTEAHTHDKLSEILSKKAELAMGDDDRRELYRRLALLHQDSRNDTAAALTAWREVLTISAQDAQANMAVEKLLLSSKNSDDLAELYRQQISQAGTAEERRSIRVKLADVQRSSLNDNNAAIESYREILQENPDDLDALRAIDALYVAEKNHSDLLEILEGERRLLKGDERLAISLRLGDLLRGPLQDGAKATALYQEILQNESAQNPTVRAALESIAQDPEHREAAAAVLKPLYQSLNDLPALRDLYELRVKAIEEKDQKKALLLEIASLCTEGLGDPKGAFEAYTRALKENLDDEDLAQTTERQTRLVSRVLPNSWELLAKIYEEALPDVFDVEAQAKAKLRLARIYEEEIKKDDLAIKHLKEATEGSLPEPKIAFDRLTALYETNNKFQDLDKTLERQLDFTSAVNEQVSLRLRRADLALKHFKKPKDALELYRTVLDDDRDNKEALSSLERLSEDTALLSQVVEILEPIYLDKSNDEALSRLYEGEAEILERGSDRTRRLEMLTDLYKNKLQSPIRAFVSTARTYADNPDDLGVLSDLEQLTVSSSLEDELAVVLSDVLLGAPAIESKDNKKPLAKPSPLVAKPLAAPAKPGLAVKKPAAPVVVPVSSETARELRLRLGRLCKGPVAEPEKALSLFQDVLKEDPENQEALDAAIELFAATSRFADLADALMKRADAEFDSTAQKSMLSKAAKLYSEKLNEPKKALAAWKKISDSDEGDLEVRASLEALLESLNEHAALVESLTIHARYVNDPKREADLIFRRAVVLEQKLKKIKDATEAYRDALNCFQAHEGALLALERLYESQGKHQDLQTLLVQRLDEVQGADRATILVRLARLAEERFKSKADAVQYYREALEAAPGHREALSNLTRLLEAENKWSDVVDLLNAQLQSAPAEEALSIRVKLAELKETRLGREDEAIETYRQVLSQSANHPAALNALARLHEKRGEWDDCLRMLELAMSNTPEGAARIDFALRVADLHYTKRKDAARAESILNAHATRPNIDAKIAKALKDLYTKENNWAKIAELVALDAEIQTETPKKLVALLEAVKLCTEKLNDSAAAIVYMEKAYALDPNLRPQLADLYIGAGRLQEALKVFEEMYNAHKAARRNKDAAKCMQRMAAIADKAGDAKTAMEKYKLAYGSDPSNPEILAAYGTFLFNAKEVAEASKIFRSLLLIPPGAQPPMPKGEIYLRLGNLSLMETPPNTQRANDMFKRGLEFDAQNASLKEALQKLKG